ncbi:hypothetical protein ACFVWY_25450 [Streptomyces sp. NPDC058195]|uniref:hypothetical protein n=1 Tax=Streptomyces sp. NPDC058195 TaxID=3346375 RepID=UPI0036EFC899
MSRRQVAGTTGRAVLRAAGPEKPSPEPVFTFRVRLVSRGRDRWTAGGVGIARAAAADARPGARSGVIRRMRTGRVGAEAAGAGFEGVAFAGVPPGAVALPGVEFEGVVCDGALRAVRCTGAGPGAAACGLAGAAGARSGRSPGAFGDTGVGVPRGSGAPGPCACVVPGRGRVVPARVRSRSPSSGASLPSRAVGGSDGSGVPIPPRARARAPEPPGCESGADLGTGLPPREGAVPGTVEDREEEDGEADEERSAVLPAGPREAAGEGALADGEADVSAGPVVSAAWRWTTGMPAVCCPSGAGDAGALSGARPAGIAPAGSSRSGRPRAGRTASTAEPSALGRLAAGAASGAEVRGLPEGAGRSGCAARGPAARGAACGPVPTDAEGAGAAGVEAASGMPTICRSGIAGRRAMMRGGAVRCGRTAAGRDRGAWAGLVTGSAGRPGADTAIGSAAGAAGAVPVRRCGAVRGAGVPPERRSGALLERWTVAGAGFPVALPLPVV